MSFRSIEYQWIHKSQEMPKVTYIKINATHYTTNQSNLVEYVIIRAAQFHHPVKDFFWKHFLQILKVVYMKKLRQGLSINVMEAYFWYAQFLVLGGLCKKTTEFNLRWYRI